MKVRVHAEHADCWCRPEQFYVMEDGMVLWLHRRDDGSLPGLLYQVTEIALHAFGDERDPGDVIAEWEEQERYPMVTKERRALITAAAGRDGGEGGER